MFSEAALDNDFVMHLAEIDNWKQSELENNIRVLFSEFKVKPVMHELVYKYELNGGAESKCKTVALDFFSNGVISIKKIEDFLDTDEKKNYYIFVLKEIYNDFKGAFPEDIKDPIREWKSAASFGETHTMAMCIILGCDIFLSDDSDAKKLMKIIKEKLAFNIQVYDRSEVCKEIASLEGSKLNKDTRKIIKHTPK